MTFLRLAFHLVEIDIKQSVEQLEGCPMPFSIKKTLLVNGVRLQCRFRFSFVMLNHIRYI